MKAVKWIRNGSGVGYGYFGGDITKLPDKEASRLRDLGLLVIIPDTIDIFEQKATVVKRSNYKKSFYAIKTNLST